MYEQQYTFLILPRSVLLRIKNIADKICTENAHFIFTILGGGKLCPLWDNVEKYGRPEEATDKNMVYAHFTLGTQSYKHTVSEYVILIDFYCCSNSCTNVHQCYVIRTLPVLFIWRRIQGWSKKYIGLHVKYPLFFSGFNETWIFSTYFLKIFKYQI
jgi:hypothetical protein